MQEKRLFGSIKISSSQDPTKMAATVSGLILSFSSLIIFVAARFFGVSLVDEQVSMFATQVGLGVGALWFLYGLVRKVLNLMSW